MAFSDDDCSNSEIPISIKPRVSFQFNVSKVLEKIVSRLVSDFFRLGTIKKVDHGRTGSGRLSVFAHIGGIAESLILKVFIDVFKALRTGKMFN